MQLKPLERDVYTDPPREAKLPNDKVLEIVLPHYGLVESSSCFFNTYFVVFFDVLRMSPRALYPFNLYQADNSKLCGIIGLSTDDSINTVNAEYQSSKDEATNSFITNKKYAFLLRFLGYLIEHDGTALCVSQPQHIDRLNVLDNMNIDQKAFHSMSRQLLFISQSSFLSTTTAIATFFNWVPQRANMR